MRLNRSFLLAASGLLLALLLLAQPASAGRWRPIGPWGGALADLVVDPAVPNRLFALVGQGYAPANQALYRSVDGGDRWELASPALPAGPFDRLVVGPGPRFQPLRSRLFALGGGIWTSGDLGRTWVSLGLGPERQIVDLAVYPEDDYPYLALDASAGPLFSNDGGAHWSVRSVGLPLGTTFFRLALDPADDRQLFLATSAGLFRSFDAAESWTATELTLPTDGLLLGPPGSGILYAFEQGSGSLWRSDDAGASWQGRNLEHAFRLLSALQVGPDDGDLLFALTEHGLQCSADGGLTWRLGGGEVSASADPLSSPRLVASPVELGRLYASAEGVGILRSDDFGDSFQVSNRGLAHLSVWDLALTAAAPAMVQVVASVAGGSVSSLYKSRNGDGVWRVRQPSGPISLSAVAIKPNEFPFTVLGTYSLTGSDETPLARTLDGGEQWDPLEADFWSPNQLLFDPLRPRRLYARVGHQVWRSADAGGVWVPAFEGLPEPCEEIWCRFWYSQELEVSPVDPGTLYFVNNNFLHRSRDAGVTWQALDLERSGLFGGLNDLALDPSDPRRLYLATSSGVYQSRDGGRTWTARSMGLPAREHAAQTVALVVDPRRPGHLLAALADGQIYRSRNGGQLWRPVEGAPPPEIGIWRLVAHPSIPHRFLALTRYGGVWQVDHRD